MKLLYVFLFFWKTFFVPVCPNKVIIIMLLNSVNYCFCKTFTKVSSKHLVGTCNRIWAFEFEMFKGFLKFFFGKRRDILAKNAGQFGILIRCCVLVCACALKYGLLFFVFVFCILNSVQVLSYVTFWFYMHNITD